MAIRLLLAAIATVAGGTLLADAQTGAASAAPTHGFAIHGTLAQAPGFAGFAYAEPGAVRGGTVRQGTTITFNSTNRMRFPGKVPNELQFIHDSLMVRALDEPASFYGLLAESVEVAPDYSSARFTLRPEARWHDGAPVTADDVAFTFETLREHGLPLYRTTLEGVSITVEGPAQILFTAPGVGDWRYLELIATFPIQAGHFWRDRKLDTTTLDIPLGSGPYRVTEFEPNRRVVLERVADYWGRDLAVNRGLWNFEVIDTLYFRDRTALIEAVKAGYLDINREVNARHWTRLYDSPALDEGRLVRSSFPDREGGWLATILFNLRRPPLDDPRVREALSLAYDGPWTRETLFDGLYAAPGPLYGPGTLSAQGMAGEGERALLEPLLADLPEGILEAPGPPEIDTLDRRRRLRRADRLLREAGYVVRDGQRVNAETGAALTLNFVSTRASLDRVLAPWAQTLGRLGITLNRQFHDYVSGREEILSHRFDLTSAGFSAEYPPGRRERVFWHSERAGEPGYALAGAEDRALDATIEAMTAATSGDALMAASRAFERVIRWRHYMLPLWRNTDHWIIHHRDLVFPYGFINPGFYAVPSLWWRDGRRPER
ncbi:MAG: extracellular solute-binding protein [Pseudomonadota bacterium]